MWLWWACRVATEVSSDSAVSQGLADVVGVSVTGSEGASTWAVSIASPDVGCDRYADWWEVLDAEGTLIYRRILDHSHVDEQPFTRDGGPVDVAFDAGVVVRAHLHPDGYGGDVASGSVSAGFTMGAPPGDLPDGLEDVMPLPESCLF